MKVRLQRLSYGLRLLLATLSLGIGTGLVGIACHYLLEGVQGLAFGQDKSDLLQQFQEAGGLRRFLVLCVTGCLSAGFWYVLQKRYIIAPNGLKVGDQLLSGAEAAPEVGNALPLHCKFI